MRGGRHTLAMSYMPLTPCTTPRLSTTHLQHPRARTPHAPLAHPPRSVASSPQTSPHAASLGATLGTGTAYLGDALGTLWSYTADAVRYLVITPLLPGAAARHPVTALPPQVSYTAHALTLEDYMPAAFARDQGALHALKQHACALGACLLLCWELIR